MSRVLPHPDDANILLAGGVNAGVWLSKDGGQSWAALGDSLPSLSIGAMAFDSGNSNRLWVGFGKQSSFAGISGALSGLGYYEFDFGAGTETWTPVGSTQLVGQDISSILVDGSRVVVGSKTSANASGVWVSQDGGASFIQTSLEAGNVTSLVADPTQAGRYYAAVVNPGDPKGVYRTDDGGQTWTQLDLSVSRPGSADGRVTYDLMLSVANDGVLVASLIEPLKTDQGLIRENPQVTVYRSTDQGATWTSMGAPSTRETLPDGRVVDWGVYTGGQFNLHGALLVDPNDSRVVYISGDTQGPFELIGDGTGNSVGAHVYNGRLLRGTMDDDGNTVWEAITNAYTANGSAPHADSRFMVIDAHGNLLETDDGGIYLRTDPKTSQGIWLSLNGNLQTGEVHAGAWNALSHTVVTAMQDNGATVQEHPGTLTHQTLSGGDGGVAAVNAGAWGGDRPGAAIYTSSQYLGGLNRLRLGADDEADSRTPLQIGVYDDQGVFKVMGEGSGAVKPPRPRKPVTKAEALAALTQPGVEPVSFYPGFKLNAMDPTRIAIGGFDLYVTQDTLAEMGPDGAPVRLVARKVFEAPTTGTEFVALAFGARNNPNALLGGTGFQSGVDAPGALYYLEDVTADTPAYTTIYSGTGVQSVLFDRNRGTERLYFADGLHIQRGTEQPADPAAPYVIENLDGDLPGAFFQRRGLDHIAKYGVSALVAAGTHNEAGGNKLYTLRGPDEVAAAGAAWDTRLGAIPNAPVFGLDYSVADDVLLAYTMGRGAFALYDVTTYFPEAEKLVFGQADNDSQATNPQLKNGETLAGVAFDRTLYKVGRGTLDLRLTTAEYKGGTEIQGGTVLVDGDGNLGAAGTGLRLDGGALGFGAAFSLDRQIELGAGGGMLRVGGMPGVNPLAVAQGNDVIQGVGALAVAGAGTDVSRYTFTRNNTFEGGLRVFAATVSAAGDAQLGQAGGAIAFDAGRLDFQSGFQFDASGLFTRPLAVGAGGGWLDTHDNSVRYAGVITGGGLLSFDGTPMEMGGDLRLDAIWNSALRVPSGTTLRGTGQVRGRLDVEGTLYPGNSPGTMSALGPVLQGPGSVYALDIDGPGTGNGAGNYSRLLVLGLGAGSTYTADGLIQPVLRGIGGSATNSYTPAVGQGFDVVVAEGGLLGSYLGLTQPADGLAPGTRFDAVYGRQVLQLYVTPAQYGDLAPLGIRTNAGQSGVGLALDRFRAPAGVRPAEPYKALYDALAPVSAAGMTAAYDQLGGAVYPVMLQADMDSHRYLNDSLMSQLWSERDRLMRPGGRGAWAYYLHRDSRLDDDAGGRGFRDRQNGAMAGMDRPWGRDGVLGAAFAYLDSQTTAHAGLGQGGRQNWQMSAYASLARGDWLLSGAVGLGLSQSSVTRGLPAGELGRMRATLDGRTLALSLRAGHPLWQSVDRGVDAWVGSQYLHVWQNAPSESGAAVVRVDPAASSMQSLRPAVGVTGRWDFTSRGVDWRATLDASLSTELLDERAALDTRFLGQDLRMRSASTGRVAWDLGAGIEARFNERLSGRLSAQYEGAQGYRATSARFNFLYRW
ncbi:autotransporter domain-containing protein [Castellaniella hirudinis]|uniref:Autotransporter domain-containing protein n=1 Tax=Castellaniella hirudinis TaxID=1144617 RepID=A0ABV8RXI9_9BURK